MTHPIDSSEPAMPVIWMRSARCALTIFGVVMAISGCEGEGSNSEEPTTAAPIEPLTTSTSVSGKVTYEMVPHLASTNGLHYEAMNSKPVRGALVELVDDSGTTLATTSTSQTGSYRFVTEINRSLEVRVKAQLKSQSNTPENDMSAPSWDMRVVDNVNDGALYTLVSGEFETTVTPVTLNLEAGAGWNGTAYDEMRAAGPFAILDTVYTSLNHVLEVSPDLDFPQLNLNWSPQNRPTKGAFSEGEIGNSLFQPSGGGRNIYILGAANADTDEYDPHIVAHEFAHYLQYHFSRSDSLGGAHSIGDRLDPRVAFGEGQATAYSAIFLDDSNYVDTLGFGQRSGSNIDIENNFIRNRGWYNEGTVQAVIFDLFDSNNDASDMIALGFEPVYKAATGRFAKSVALTTIHSYLDAVKTNHPSLSSAIDQLAFENGIVTSGSDAYGSGETNSARRYDSVLPIYLDLPLDGSIVTACTIAGDADFGTYNKLSNRRLLKFSITNPIPNVFTTITATGPADSDPEMILHQVGKVQSARTSQKGFEQLRRIFTAGDYVLEVVEYSNMTDTPYGDVCFDLQVGTG